MSEEIENIMMFIIEKMIDDEIEREIAKRLLETRDIENIEFTKKMLELFENLGGGE